jgi:hypothetical protein
MGRYASQDDPFFPILTHSQEKSVRKMRFFITLRDFPYAADFGGHPARCEARAREWTIGRPGVQLKLEETIQQSRPCRITSGSE